MYLKTRRENEPQNVFINEFVTPQRQGISFLLQVKIKYTTYNRSPYKIISVDNRINLQLWVLDSSAAIAAPFAISQRLFFFLLFA